jgi:hypothetical protein
MLALQRTAGNRATVSLTRGTTVVQRKRTALTSKEVLASLKALPFMKGKLDQTIHGKMMEQRVAAEMRSYKTHFGKKTDEDLNVRDAMMLSIALEGVARIISEELNDASVQPAVMAKLFELYQADVGTSVRKKKSSLRPSKSAMPKILGLTGALMDGDPVTQYMHREIHLDVAAAQIAAMATKAQTHDPTMTPERMYELLEQRFQAKMSTYSKSELYANDPTKSYGLDETHGEYSQYFFQKLFGTDAFAGAGGGAAWDTAAKGQPDRMKFTADSEQRLAALLAKVKAPATNGPQTKVRDPKLTPRQEQHLASVEAEESIVNQGDMKRRFAALFVERYSLTQADATKLFDNVADYLRTAIPLTITAKADDWFGAGKTTDSEFKPATAAKKQTNVSTLFSKPQAQGDIAHLPTWADKVPTSADARGPKYLRFRHWKDQLLTGLRDLQSDEMAVFGAANPTWEGARGSDTPTEHGTNYYGDFHFVLDRGKVKDRMVYTATDHGAPRRDPVLALNDFAFGGKGLTWLKDVKRTSMLDAVVNAVRLKTALYGMPLLFEVQIFGGVNIKTDVKEVNLSSKVSATAEQNITNFYQGTAVAIKKIDANAPTGRVFSPGGLTELDALAMVAAGYGDTAEKQAFEADTAGVTDQLTRVPIRVAYGLALYIKQAATQGKGGLSDEDKDVLDKSLARMKSMAKAGASLSGPIKKNLADRMQEAEQALTAAKAEAAPEVVDIDTDDLALV